MCDFAEVGEIDYAECFTVKMIYNVHLPCGTCKMRRYNKLASSYTRYQYIYRNCVIAQHIPKSLNLW